VDAIPRAVLARIFKAWATSFLALPVNLFSFIPKIFPFSVEWRDFGYA